MRNILQAFFILAFILPFTLHNNKIFQDHYEIKDTPFEQNVIDNTRYFLLKAGYYTDKDNPIFIKQYGITFEPDKSVTILFNC